MKVFASALAAASVLATVVHAGYLRSPDRVLQREGPLGCYDVSVHVCMCSPETCNEEKCTGLGFIWTQGCNSLGEDCVCSEAAEEASAAPPEASIESPSSEDDSCKAIEAESYLDDEYVVVTYDSAISIGCIDPANVKFQEKIADAYLAAYASINGACSQEGAMCEMYEVEFVSHSPANNTFLLRTGTYCNAWNYQSDEKNMCGIELFESDAEDSEARLLQREGPLGCYDVSVHQCMCSSENCNEEKCTGLGFYWTQGCNSLGEDCVCSEAADEASAESLEASANTSGSLMNDALMVAPASVDREDCSCPRPTAGDVLTNFNLNILQMIFSECAFLGSLPTAATQRQFAPVGWAASSEQLCEVECADEEAFAYSGDGVVPPCNTTLFYHPSMNETSSDVSQSESSSESVEEVWAQGACFDTELQLCDCAPNRCNEGLCVADGGIWSNLCPDKCQGCVVPSEESEESEEEAPAQPVRSGPSGCYDVSVHRCSCNDMTCSEEKCSGLGFSWTSGCNSLGSEDCECGAPSETAEEDSEEEAPAQPVRAGPLGCYDVSVHRCICGDTSCNEEKCSGLGFSWTSGCNSLGTEDCECPN